MITAICETHRSDSDLLFSPNILIYPDAHLAAAVLVISVGDTNVGLGMHWDSHRWCGCPEATSVFGSVFQAAPLHRSLIDHPLVAPASAARALSMLL